MIKKKKKRNGEVVFLPTLPPSSGPCKCLPGKRENRENLLRERRRGGGDATEGERGGVTAEREEGGGRRGKEREGDELVYLVFISAEWRSLLSVHLFSLGAVIF